jgi:hypothetical protein
MTSLRLAARKAITAGVTPAAARVTDSRGSFLSRYERDPFAHVDEGHITILDLETSTQTRLKPWPHQVKLTEAWIDLARLRRTGSLRFRNAHLEKSRQEGVTWWVAYLLWWVLNYHEVPGLAMSLKAAEIDDGGGNSTPRSFFGRIRYIHTQASLPPHLRAPLEWRGGADPSIRNTHKPLAFLNGTGAVADPGRGGKYGYVFVDEAARLPFARAVQASISLACPVGRLYNSTPEGEDNLFYWLRERRPRGYRFLRFHWTRHPVYSRGLHVAASVETDEQGRTTGILTPGLRGCPLCEGTRRGLRWDANEPRAHRYPGKPTSPWYEQAILDLTDEQVASELEIDYAGSLTARVYPEFSEELHCSDVVIPYDDRLGLDLTFDYGAGTTSVVIGQETPLEYRVVGEVEAYDTLPEEVAAAVRAQLVAIGVPAHLTSHEWTRRMSAYGDPAGEARQQATGKPLTAEYRRLGFEIYSKHESIERTIRAVKRLLKGRPKPVVVSARCTQFVRHMKHNRWPVDRNGDRRAGATEPQNDEHNHMMRAFAYMAVQKWPPPEAADAIHRATVDRAHGGRLDDGLSYGMDL